MNSTVEKLRKIGQCLARIEILESEIENLKTMAAKVTSTLGGEVVSGSRNQDKMGDTISKMVDYQKSLQKQLAKQIDLREHYLAMVCKVEDDAQMKVLYKLYFEGKTYEQIGYEIGYSERHAKNIHGRALQAIETIMKEGGEPDVERQTEPGKE